MEIFGSGATEHAQLSEFGGAGHSHVTQPLIPIVEVAFRNNLWWSIPKEMSQQIVEKMRNNEDARYTWDWGPNVRLGSWRPHGEQTSINRYQINFGIMKQTNIDNGRQRSIRIVYVRPEDVDADFTGELAVEERYVVLESIAVALIK